MNKTLVLWSNPDMITSPEIVNTDVADEAAMAALKAVPIPSCPQIVLKLLEATRRADADSTKIARLITADVTFAASVLRMANSPFFGLRRRVQSVKLAVAVLGTRNLIKIIYGVMLRDRLGGSRAPALRRFWERSNYNAVVCTQLASRLRGVSIDDAYTFGLFHDAGIAVLMQRFADYPQTLIAANAASRSITAVEDEHYATNHVIVGALLAHEWFLPDHVVRAIRYHHDYSVLGTPRPSISAEVCSLVAVRLISEHVVARFLDRQDDAEWHQTKELALSYLGWGEPDVDALMLAMHEHLEEIRRFRGEDTRAA